MGAGRVCCVALPLILTATSLIAFLVATLSGVGSDALYIFQVNLDNFSISPSDLANIASDLGVDLTSVDLKARHSTLDDRTSNLTAADLGLDNDYDVSLWGYCEVHENGKRQCTTPEFNWASTKLNDSFLEDFASVAGQTISLPKEIQDSLKIFREGIKWTEVAYMAANVALGLELLVGVLAICSRGASCITWLVATVAATLVCISAGATTAMAVIIVGAINGVAEAYDVKSSVGTGDLAAVWIAAASAIAAAAAWIFTICCCKPDHRRDKSYKRNTADEKLLPSSYAPLGHEHDASGGSGYYNNYDYGNSNPYYNNVQPRFAQFESDHQDEFYDHAGQASRNERPDLAYEPYSQRA